MSSIDVVYTCDYKFLEYLAVSIDSMMSSMSDDGLSRLVVHVIQIDFSVEQKMWLQALMDRRNKNAKLIFYDYKIKNKFAKCKYKAVEIVTLVYYLPNFLQDVDRVIFVDADTLFLADISELWQLELEGHWIATTPGVLSDESLLGYAFTSRGRYWSAEQTINAGIMLIDLRQMRVIDATSRLEAWTEKYQERLKLPEQEAIAFNYPIRKLIEHKWNWRGALKYAEMHWSAKSQIELIAYDKIEPSMVHLQNPCRPLNTIINSKYFHMWIERYHAIGLKLPKRELLDFSMFVFLMAEDKSAFQNRRRITFTILNLPFWFKCVFLYRKYSKDPENFEFPTIEPRSRVFI